MTTALTEESKPLSAQIVSSFLATAMVKTAKGTTPETDQLAAAIDEIELETQIAGASFIKVYVTDPYWVIATSGWLDVNEEGLLDEIEVEFPEKSGWMWVLCALELTLDVTQPMILTFEDKIIARLRKKWGPKNAPPSTTTRAQFVKALVDEVGVSGIEPAIRFECPALNVVQPVETKTEGELETGGAAEAATAKGNKSRAVSAGSAITIKGAKPDMEQIQAINVVMGVCNEKDAGPLATLAIVEAAIAESTFRPTAKSETGAAGVFQLEPATAQGTGLNPSDTQTTAEYWLEHGFGGRGGGIELAQKNPSWSAGKVAFEVERGGSESGFNSYKAEAEAIIHAYGGITLGKKATGESDVKQLKRGSGSNPDEDSWECITRLAQQVDWFAFSNGNTLFYMDGPSLRDQAVTLFLNAPENLVYRDVGGHKIEEDGLIATLTANWDNTAFEYRATHKVKGRTQRKSKISKPSTPSEIKMTMVCAPGAYRAGDVFEFVDSGPLNMRWIVTDATRNCLKDTFTTFTLEPPVAPLPEPEASEKTSTAQESGAEGSANSAVEAAKKALAEQKAKHIYEYTESIPARENNGTLYGPAPRTMDCSAFVTLCFKAAGLPDPSNKGYSPIGNTDSIIANCTKVGNPVPGDLCFFGASTSATTHVTIYVGNGNAISMGAPGDPEEGPAPTTGPSGFLGYFRVNS
jgi:cell wall-associated NlpC family hydrolase